MKSVNNITDFGNEWLDYFIFFWSFNGHQGHVDWVARWMSNVPVTQDSLKIFRSCFSKNNSITTEQNIIFLKSYLYAAIAVHEIEIEAVANIVRH